MNWLEIFKEPAYALLRAVTGFMFAFHGVQKIFGVPCTASFSSSSPAAARASGA